MEREAGFEPAASTLERLHSTRLSYSRLLRPISTISSWKSEAGVLIVKERI